MHDDGDFNSTVFDESNDAILLIDAHNDRFIDANPAATRLLGYERHELLSMDPSDIHPHEVERIRAFVEQVKHNGRGFTDELSCRTRWGALVPAELSLSTMTHDGRSLILVLLRDVSDRRATESALRRSEDRYRDLFDSAFDVVLLVDGHGDIVDINKRAAEITGWSCPELLRFNVLRDLVVEEDHPLLRSVLDDVARGHERLYDIRWATKDGRIIAFEGATNARLDGDGNFMWTRCTLRDVTRRKDLEQQLIHSTLYDSLTGLPNRALLLDRLGELIQRRNSAAAARHIAVLFVGLDQFSSVNDSLGHEAGDEILNTTATRLQGILDPSDQLGRAGGDEFVIVRLVDDIEGAVELADAVLAELGQPFAVHTDHVVVGASVGIALASEDDPTAPDMLLRKSHTALHRAKALGRARWVVFAADQQARANRLVKTRSDLHHAISHGELVLHYQPLISTASGKPVGVEALVRWQHPTHGLLGPDRFITVAEQTGLIAPLGQWVLREACTTLSDWHRTHPELTDLRVSVNVAVDQLVEPGFVSEVEEICSNTNTYPGHLILEITETGLMTDPDTVERTLWGLRDIGVGIAIDDFGVGYSSLGYLRRFPIDRIKIDRSFVQGLPGDRDSQAIVNAVTQMAQTLDMTVVAEGVEHTGQLNAVLASGCDIVQGYLFGRPAPAPDAVAAILRIPVRVDAVARNSREIAPVQSVPGRNFQLARSLRSRGV